MTLDILFSGLRFYELTESVHSSTCNYELSDADPSSDEMKGEEKGLRDSR